MSKIQSAPTGKAQFGFWVYLMTDCVLFASLFATYAVLRNSIWDGPAGYEIFNQPYALAMTLVLLTSSLTCALALVAARRGDLRQTLLWFGVTAALGLVFLGMELREFTQLIHEGNSWRRSGFLTAFFSLVGMHGLHITVGILWMVVAIVHLAKRGLTESALRKVTLLGMFWHFLDIVWIFIFTIVYLMGALQL